MKPINTPTATAPAKTFGLVTLAAVMAAGLMLSGCNTTAGAGKDISAGGKDLTNTATSVQKKL